MRLDLIEAFGTTPRSIRSSPLRRLPVLSHFSYKRSRSALEVHAVRSLTSERTSTNAGNFVASSPKTGDRVSASWRLSAL